MITKNQKGRFNMSFFKKKNEKKACCCEACNNETMAKAEKSKDNAGIKILGTGCAKCNALEKATVEALHQLNMDVEIEHITDFSEIAVYGVMTTPALVIDGKVVSLGKVLKVDEVIEILKEKR